MQHKITILHVYQDVNNPSEQTVYLDGEYAIIRAFFIALIDSHLDFKVELAPKED